jgi:hypothetical protein
VRNPGRYSTTALSSRCIAALQRSSYETLAWLVGAACRLGSWQVASCGFHVLVSGMSSWLPRQTGRARVTSKSELQSNTVSLACCFLAWLADRCTTEVPGLLEAGTVLVSLGLKRHGGDSPTEWLAAPCKVPSQVCACRYEKARDLKKYIDRIRDTYTRHWDSTDRKTRQVGCCWPGPWPSCAFHAQWLAAEWALAAGDCQVRAIHTS